MAIDQTSDILRLAHMADGASPELPPARAVTLPGRGTTYVLESEGPRDAPTVMLLHGLGATASLNWFSTIPALEGRFHVLALDHRGHGRGIRCRTPFALEDAADDVVALADALGVERFVAVGYSMGGPVAQLLWKRHRDRVSGLVMCATSSRFRATSWEHVMFSALPALEHAWRVVPSAVTRRVISQISKPRLAETGFAEWASREFVRMDHRAVLQAAAALGSYSGERWISQIDVPTSVLVHTRDQVVPPSRQVELAFAIPNAFAHFVDGDHYAVVRDARPFVNALTRAISDVTAPQLPTVVTAPVLDQPPPTLDGRRRRKVTHVAAQHSTDQLAAA